MYCWEFYDLKVVGKKLLVKNSRKVDMIASSHEVMCILNNEKHIICSQISSEDAILITEYKFKMFTLAHPILCGVDIFARLFCFKVIVMEDANRNRRLKIDMLKISQSIIVNVKTVAIDRNQICYVDLNGKLNF